MKVKGFSEIPGPKSIPVLGTLWKYLPLFGPYRFDQLHKTGAKKLEEFGPVVKEEIVPGTNIVYIFRPEDIQELYRKEGRFPERRSHLAVDYIRKSKPDLYNSGGLLPTNGKEWWRLRSLVQKNLSSPRTVRNFLPDTIPVFDDFLVFIEKNYCDEEIKDFLPALSRLYLERVIAFGKRFNSFSELEMKKNSKTSQLLAAAFNANSCIFGLDNGLQLWKLLKTPLYRKFETSHNYMEKIAVEMMEYVKRNSKNDCLVNIFLNLTELNEKDILGTIVDMFLAAMDTTTYTTSFALYHLSKHPEKQEKLFQAILNEIPNGEGISPQVLASCHYVKAVVKETLRLNPVSIGIGRLLQEDAVFSGYHVPKNTVIVTQNQVTCRQSEFFSDPDAFIPERWLQENRNSVHPYLLLPFGHGPRTCIARRLAEQNMQVFLLKVVRKFSLEWKGEELGVRSVLINQPDGPILVRFKLR